SFLSIARGTQVMADHSEKVKDIIEKELGVEREKLTNEASFIDDLGADSLDIVELVMEFEKEFNIDIPDEDAEKLRTVGDALGDRNETVKAWRSEGSAHRGSVRLRQSATPWRRPGVRWSTGAPAPRRSRSSTRAASRCDLHVRSRGSIRCSTWIARKPNAPM